MKRLLCTPEKSNMDSGDASVNHNRKEPLTKTNKKAALTTSYKKDQLTKTKLRQPQEPEAEEAADTTRCGDYSADDKSSAVTMNTYVPVIDWKWDDIPLMFFKQAQMPKRTDGKMTRESRKENTRENDQSVGLDDQEVDMLNKYLAQVEMVVKYAARCSRLESLLKTLISQMRDTQNENRALQHTLMTYKEITLRESIEQREKFDAKMDKVAEEINNLKKRLKDTCDVTDEYNNSVEARNYRKLWFPESDGSKVGPGRQPNKKDVVTTLNALLHRIQRGEGSVDTLKFVTEELKCIVRETRESTQPNRTQTKKGRKKSSHRKNRGR